MIFLTHAYRITTFQEKRAIYDTQTRSRLQTDQQFPTLGSQDKGIKKNADGSYDIYFSPKPPKGRSATGFRPFPARAGLSPCGCTVLKRPGSTRPGGRVKSNWWNK